MKSRHEPLGRTQSNHMVALRLIAFVLTSIAIHSALLLLEQPHNIDLGTERSLAIRLVERQQQQPDEKAQRTAKLPTPVPDIVPIPQATRAKSTPVQKVEVRNKPDTSHHTVKKSLAADQSATEPAANNQATLHASIQGRLKRELARHFSYPLPARKRGWQGEVILAFFLEPDGRITGARIARSSGYSVLDRAALTALGRIKQIETGRAYGFAMKLPVIYRLEG